MSRHTTAILAAPSVKEADGDLLRPDMMPRGPTVQIPRYADSRAGDRISLTWLSNSPAGGSWNDEHTLATDDEECRFGIPAKLIFFAEGFGITAQYSVMRKDTGVEETSAIATFTVQSYAAFRIIRAIDENGEWVGSIRHDAESFDVRLPGEFSRSLEEGDEVVVYLRGVANQMESSMIQKASMVWILSITAENEGKPVSCRIPRNIIAANYGELMQIYCSVVRHSGYIQYPDEDAVLVVTRDVESLTPVRIPELTDDVLILDTWGAERDLAVSIVRQTETEGATVRFHLDDSAIDADPVDDRPFVYGTIPRDVLEQHADTDCYLYCVATKTDENGTTVARSGRRHLTIRRSALGDPLPAADTALAPPSIDGLPSGVLDPAAFPTGPIVRLKSNASIEAGDTVTLIFSIPNGIVSWKHPVNIDAANVGKDLVIPLPMWFLSYGQRRDGSLYYTVENPAGVVRWSPVQGYRIGMNIQRVLYLQFGYHMRKKSNDTNVTEALPDEPLTIACAQDMFQFAAGDQLVITVLGRTIDISDVWEIPVGPAKPPWSRHDIPIELIQRNAGNDVRFKVTRVRDGLINQMPFKMLSVLSATGQNRPSPSPTRA